MRGRFDSSSPRRIGSRAVLGLVTAAALIAGAPVVGAGTDAGARDPEAGSAARPATVVKRYSPFSDASDLKSHLRPRYLGRGDCWTTSLVVAARNVFRCMKGRYIYDPCYYDLYSRQERVVCATAPWKRKVFIIRSRPPDDTRVYGKRRPWGLILTSGRRCLYASGASTVVDGRRLNYFCTRKRYLFGWPDRRRRRWTIRQARDPEGRGMRKVRVRKAWL